MTLATVTAGGCALALYSARPAALIESANQSAVVEEPVPHEPSTGLRQLSKLLWRCAELFIFLGPVLSWYFMQQLPLIGRAFSRQRLLSLLIGSLARCGPVGIKWGQWGSTRYDLFEEDFCEALGTLTNNAPSHSYACTRETVERSFGQPMDVLFEKFDEKPLASGSIGQVRMCQTTESTFPSQLYLGALQ